MPVPLLLFIVLITRLCAPLNETADPNATRAVLDPIPSERGDAPRNARPAAQSGSGVSIGGETVIPFERSDPLPQILVRVNGRRARVAIDTGGPGLDLAPAFAHTLGIRTTVAGEAVFAGDRRVEIRAGHVDRLELGAASIRSLPVHIPPALPPGIDGIVGTNVLDRFLATLDYPNRRLVLRPRAASRRFEASAAQRGAVIVPLLRVPDHYLFVCARVGRGPNALYAVDTGGPGIGVDLTRATIAAAGIVPDAAHPVLFSGGGGPTRALTFTTDVTLGDRTFRAVPGLYLPDGNDAYRFGFAVAGRLSQELFRRGSLTFDFSAMRLIFEVPADRRSTAPARRI